MKFLFAFFFSLIALIYFSCDNKSNPTNYDKDTTYVYNKDTLYISDTTHKIDSTVILDTVFSFDTIHSNDTIVKIDTVRRIDTIKAYDTIYSRDTVHYYDTIYSIDTIIVSQNTWAQIIDSIAGISYMIAIRFESTGELELVGSGFAITPNTILTNAHVYIGALSAYIIYKQKGYNVKPVAVRNGQSSTGQYAFILDTGGYHTQYVDTTNFTHDIGFFKTSSSMSKWISLQSALEIQKIKVGQEIGTLGYPGETSDRINRIAYATFKNGVISSLSPFNSSDVPTISNTLIVQHNLNTSGGTSGSPIFDILGNLVAINNSSKKEAIWDDATGRFKYIPTGAVAWAIRADDYWNMLLGQLYTYERISLYPIPQNYNFYPNSKICLSDGTKPVSVGTTIDKATVFL
jgi:V8-like Glu-specific endopeptidase